MTARFVTTAPAGHYPAGLVVDVIEITAHAAYDEHARDAHTDPRVGDGQWLRVRHPGGIHLGTVRTPAELTERFGIDLGSLEEVRPARVTCRAHHAKAA
jgi:hypothetical protein